VVLQTRIFFSGQPEKKIKFEEPFEPFEPDFLNQILGTLFYTFLEKWFQIKWSNELKGNLWLSITPCSLHLTCQN
jgi:hypothetical protein